MGWDGMGWFLWVELCPVVTVVCLLLLFCRVARVRYGTSSSSLIPLLLACFMGSFFSSLLLHHISSSLIQLCFVLFVWFWSGLVWLGLIWCRLAGLVWLLFLVVVGGNTGEHETRKHTTPPAPDCPRFPVGIVIAPLAIHRLFMCRASKQAVSVGAPARPPPIRKYGTGSSGQRKDGITGTIFRP
jgi:uncharacterized membrane protein YfcA